METTAMNAIEPFAPSSGHIVENVADVVGMAVAARLRAAAEERGGTLVVETIHPLAPRSGHNVICHSWKIISRGGVALSVELIGYRGDAGVLARVDGRALVAVPSIDDRAAHLLAAEVGLALDVVLLEPELVAA